MARIKCLHIITGLSTGGAERALYNVLFGGLAKDFECQVVSLSDEGTFGRKLLEANVPVTCLRIRRGVPSIDSILRLRRLVCRFDPHVIQGWMYHGNLAARLATGMAPGQPTLVWNIRHSLYGLGEEKLMTRQAIRANRFFSGRPDRIFYNSSLSREHHEVFGFTPERGKVIPNGFDLDSLGPSEQTAQAVRGALGIPRAALVVGHVARFHPMKDHRRFVRAAVRVGLQIENVHFMLCGKDVVPDNDALVGLVPPSMCNQFHWLGERDDVPDILCATDVLCQSSWSEAFPNVLGEAMATSVPCVATDVGDTAEIIDDTGLVVPPRDEVALASALMKMLEIPAHERAALGARARVCVAEKYSLDAVTKQYSAEYERLATPSKGLN